MNLAEFFQKEIDSLTIEGALTLLRLENIEDVSIIMGEIFIKYFDCIVKESINIDNKY